VKRLIADTSKWALFLHRDARGLNAAELSDGALLQFGDELFTRLYQGELEHLPVEQRSREFGEWANQLHATCDGLPAFGRLAAEVRGDAVGAAIATEELLDVLGPEPSQPQPPTLAHRQLQGGCNSAAAAVEEFRDTAEGLSGVFFGRGVGVHQASDGAAYRELATRLKGDTRLRRIALLAGRFRRIAATTRRQRVRHGADEVSDIEHGGDIARLLAVELSKLSHPHLRLSLLRDISEKQAMQYRLSGSEKLGKGPLVVCIDKSGSMEGDNDIFATATALAILKIAQAERRSFALLCFDSGILFEAVVRPGETLPAEALFVRPSGGTEIGGVVARGLQLIAENPGQLRKADLVLVTDGASATNAAAELRARALQMGVTVLGVGINVEPSALEPWCDEIEVVHSTDQLDSKTAEMLFAR
jgi:Mg-chelatase subunit ChlD